MNTIQYTPGAYWFGISYESDLAFMQAVKAELAATRLDEAKLVMSLIEAEQLPAVRARIAELRNHFGIGEEV